MAQQDMEIHRLQEQVANMQQGTPASPAADADRRGPGGRCPHGSGAPGGSGRQRPERQGHFKDGLFLWLETPNKDFTMHIGGWMQLDNVWWDQTSGAEGHRDGKAGPPPGRAYRRRHRRHRRRCEDGEYFRRIRPFIEGTFWETGEYRLIPALENNQFSTAGLDEFWVGETKIPVIGNVRVGHVKDPMGLEGDMTASSRCMTFMERSAYSEAIELNQNFLTGLWMATTTWTSA